MNPNPNPSRRSALKVIGVACLGGGALAQRGFAVDASVHAHHDHAAHRAQAAATTTRRRSANYTPAPVRLIRHDGLSMPLATALDDGRPVLLNFIFTS